MAQEAVQEVLIDETINFNGPEDDADDVYDDDFEIEEIDSIGEFEDFDDDDF
ncbi:hypothetical protein [Sphingobacterium psychroaquaticum]|uniref:Uncharacterized protein n=1 Tax=Sphingobacterium psychroaquaticum TaxID=561061 RepID=A0A1X7JMW6_9SPHI|nr:hypothetical protein [Sphingobacterium psychroaquaticum]SMG29558.1 hypothetical protein SAMN05660862_1936 [Sphingobacterium psychroaquaticum]